MNSRGLLLKVYSGFYVPSSSSIAQGARACDNMGVLHPQVVVSHTHPGHQSIEKALSIGSPSIQSSQKRIATFPLPIRIFHQLKTKGTWKKNPLSHQGLGVIEMP